MPKGNNMTTERYFKFVKGKFGEWHGKHDLLVQDHEKGLKAPASLKAVKSVDLGLFSDPVHPKYSQDLNAIGIAGGGLRARTEDTTPIGDAKEDLLEFVVRLGIST